jgi:hypothetical protein
MMKNDQNVEDTVYKNRNERLKREEKEAEMKSQVIITISLFQ